jgi:membrane-associated phospholipid phosphatase
MPRPPSHHAARPAAARDRHAAVRDTADLPWHGLARLLAGVALFLLVLLLGMLAKTSPVSGFSLRVDRHLATYDRTSTLTALARAATTLATPEIVGLGLMILIPVILLLMRRRLDAVKVFCMIAGAFTLAEIGKKLISEHRPPEYLWAMKADSGASYPSGHTATAAVLAVALIVIAASYAGRSAALVLGSLYVLAVAASRVYLADHYPLDVIGGIMCALAAALIVTGLAALPVLQPYLRRLEAARYR